MLTGKQCFTACKKQEMKKKDSLGEYWCLMKCVEEFVFHEKSGKHFVLYVCQTTEVTKEFNIRQ